jgi:hypothetical protein
MSVAVLLAQEEGELFRISIVEHFVGNPAVEGVEDKDFDLRLIDRGRGYRLGS